MSGRTRSAASTTRSHVGTRQNQSWAARPPSTGGLRLHVLPELKQGEPKAAKSCEERPGSRKPRCPRVLGQSQGLLQERYLCPQSVGLVNALLDIVNGKTPYIPAALRTKLEENDDFESADSIFSAPPAASEASPTALFDPFRPLQQLRQLVHDTLNVKGSVAAGAHGTKRSTTSSCPLASQTRLVCTPKTSRVQVSRGRFSPNVPAGPTATRPHPARWSTTRSFSNSPRPTPSDDVSLPSCTRARSPARVTTSTRRPTCRRNTRRPACSWRQRPTAAAPMKGLVGGGVVPAHGGTHDRVLGVAADAAAATRPGGCVGLLFRVLRPWHDLDCRPIAGWQHSERGGCVSASCGAARDQSVCGSGFPTVGGAVGGF